MSDIVFGRYSPSNSIVHKIDARNKILMLILLVVTVFLQFKVWSTMLIISGFLLCLLIILMLVSKVSIRELFKSLASMWILVIFLLVIYIFIPNPNYKMQIGSSIFYWDAFYQCAYIILRLLMMVVLTMVLTTTTKPMELTYGLEWYMTPLKPIHFPAHEIAMTLSIALRFIPTLLEESEKIMKAQASRGVDLKYSSLPKKVFGVISLIIPLFISSIERSEELANAMEARGYDPQEKRSRYRILSFHVCDLISILIVLLIFGGVLTMFIFDQNGDGFNIIYLISGWKPPF